MGQVFFETNYLNQTKRELLSTIKWTPLYSARTVVKFCTHFPSKTSKEIDASTLLFWGLRSRKMEATYDFYSFLLLEYQDTSPRNVSSVK